MAGLPLILWHPQKVCSWSDYTLSRIMPWVCLWGCSWGRDHGLSSASVGAVLEKGMEAVPEGTHVRFGTAESISWLPAVGAQSVSFHRKVTDRSPDLNLHPMCGWWWVKKVRSLDPLRVMSKCRIGMVCDRLDAQNLPLWYVRKGLLFVMGWMLAAVMLVVLGVSLAAVCPPSRCVDSRDEEALAGSGHSNWH